MKAKYILASAATVLITLIAAPTAFAKADPADVYAGGQRLGERDPYTDGGKAGKFDVYSDGARVGDPRDPFTDGSKSGRFDPYTDGTRASVPDLAASALDNARSGDGTLYGYRASDPRGLPG